MSEPGRLRIALAVFALAGLAAGCRMMMRDSQVPRLTVSELARDLARGPVSFKGRMVRVCRGRLAQVQPVERREWQFAALGETFPHGASVTVKACGDTAPRLDTRGCLQGRIARPDGTVREPGPDEPSIVSDSIESYDWYLHASCEARAEQ